MSRFQFHSSRYLDFSLRSTELVFNYMASWFVYPISLIITDDPKARMIGMHKTQSDEARLDLLSLII